MKSAKAMTIRLSSEQALELETVAAVDDKPVSAVIRAAIDAHIEQRKQDQGFQENLKDRIALTERMLRS